MERLDVEAFLTATSGESRKQRDFVALDRHLLAAARAARGLRRPVIIHPSLLYELLYPYWKDQLPARAIFEHLTFRRLAPPSTPVPALPKDYVAVRFYFSDCFPDTTDNRAFVDRVIRDLASVSAVVLLQTPFALDDHRDADPAAIPGVQVVSSFDPRSNLAAQSAIIAGARAFVGTYGGFSYLAPFYDVPSVAFYSRETFFPHHLDVARRAYSGLGVRGLTVTDIRDAGLVRDALGRTPQHV
jgi:hypothetical protein